MPVHPLRIKVCPTGQAGPQRIAGIASVSGRRTRILEQLGQLPVTGWYSVIAASAAPE